MKTRRLQTLFPLGGSLLVLAFASCEREDVALQQEMAELRERAARAEESAEAASAKLEKEALLPLVKLKSGLQASSEDLRDEIAAALPGYRAERVVFGPVVYVLEESEKPYRAGIEIHVKPSSPSALTPELPPIEARAVAGSDGVWTLPGAPELRALQAEASARAVAKADAAMREKPSGSSPQGARPSGSGSAQESQGLQPPPGDPNARVISWGDEPRPPAQQPAPPPNAGPSRPAPRNLPQADQSYEIRFD